MHVGVAVVIAQGEQAEGESEAAQTEYQEPSSGVKFLIDRSADLRSAVWTLAAYRVRILGITSWYSSSYDNHLSLHCWLTVDWLAVDRLAVGGLSVGGLADRLAVNRSSIWLVHFRKWKFGRKCLYKRYKQG